MSSPRQDFRRLAGICLIVLAGLSILTYAYFKTKNLIEGPQITVLSPQSGEAVAAAHVILTGTSRNIARLTVNGRAVSVDQSGGFSEDLVLHPGYTIVSVRGEDRFGKEREVTLQLMRVKATTLGN